MDDWTIKQDEKNIIRIYDEKDWLVGAFKYKKLKPNELEAILDVYKFFLTEVYKKIDDYILNGGEDGKGASGINGTCALHDGRWENP